MSPVVRNFRQVLINLFYCGWPIIASVAIFCLAVGLWLRNSALKEKAEAEVRERAETERSEQARRQRNAERERDEQRNKIDLANQEKERNLMSPSLLDITNRTFAFFFGTNPIIGYVRGADNRIKLWSQPSGIDRTTGETIQPITREIVKEYENFLRKQLETEISEQTKSNLVVMDKTKTRVRPSLQEIANGTFSFFESGNPKVGYVLGDDGRIELWSQPHGSDPITSRRIEPVTREIALKYQADLKEQINAEAERIAKDEAKSVEQKKKARDAATILDKEIADKKEREAKANNAKILEAKMQAEKEAKDIAEREAAERRFALQTKYLWPLEREEAAKHPRIAVVAASRSQPKAALALTKAVSQMASRSGFSAVDNLFKDEFISDGSFDRAFNGSLDSLNDLSLSNRCEYFALCQLTLAVPSASAVDSLKVVAGKFQIKLFSSATGSFLFSQEYNAEAKKYDAEKAIPLVHAQLLESLATNSFSLSANHK